MQNVVLNHISSIGCCNPLGQTNPMLDSTTMLDNGNLGFLYSFLPRFPPLPSGATISSPSISTPFIFDAPAFLVAHTSFANALQLEAARVTPVLFSLQLQRHAKFEVAKPIYCCIIALLLLIHYFTL